VDSIKNLNVNENSYMTRFDVTSLYTNVPVLETIKILCEKAFAKTSFFHGFNRKTFEELLTLSVSQTYFLFNSILYQQIDGLSMGNPLAPTLANIFLCNLENEFLEACPAAFRPIFYKRYLDDTFVIFKEKQHARLFLDFINNFHGNIEFTMDGENENKLSFLDVLVTRSGTKLTSSIYRKRTFTGLGTSYFSITPHLYKVNAIKTLISRAYHLCSTFRAFDDEVNFLRTFFANHGYPTYLLDKFLKVFLNKIYVSRPVVHTVAKEKVFISLPYLGDSSTNYVQSLKNFLSSHYPQIDFKFCLKNSFKIRNFFKYKDYLPSDVRSNIIYKFSCVACNGSYIGSTSRQARVRFSEHLGISHRTTRQLQRPPHSNPRAHCENLNHPFKLGHFSIIDSANNSADLKILESLHILKNRPTLTSDLTSTPLYLT
jgi:hypothetical protein